jgi:chromosome partitioning protein
MKQKIVLITHSKGGVGKSTLSYLIALNLNSNFKVAILDIDLQGSLSRLSNTTEELHITTDRAILKEDSGFQIIFIDAPPYLSNQIQSLIRLADLIVVPTKAGILDVLAITSTLNLIKNEKMDAKALIVLNMIKPNTTLTENIMKSLVDLEIRVAKQKISDLVAFTRAVALGGVSYDKNAQNQLDCLTEEILTFLL